MSRIAAIDVALRHQLVADGKDVNYKTLFGHGGYDYTDNTVQIFLLNVANRLRLDVPSLRFDWKDVDPGRCLASDLVILIALIETLVRIEDSAT